MAYTIDYRDAERQFIDFLYDHGLREPRGGFVLDGAKINYCPVDGKPANDTTGRYMFWANGKSGDGRPHGWCMDMRDSDTQHNWQYKGEYVQPTAEERKAYSAKQRKQERERKKRSSEALAKARVRFDGAKPANSDHPYLVSKGISEYRGDIRQDGETLLVPYTLISSRGNIKTLQTISPKGDKRFSKDISIPADAAFVISGDANNDRIFVAEGMATAQSAAAALSMGSGYRSVLAAGNCARLEGVLEAVRAKAPAAEVYILADDDYKKSDGGDESRSNPGLSKACILLSKGYANGILVPSFPRNPGSADDEANKPSDWNDYVQTCGREAASVELEKQIKLMRTYAKRQKTQSDLAAEAEAAALKTVMREAKAKAKQETAAEEKARRRAEFEAHLKDMEAERGFAQILEDTAHPRETVSAVIRAMQKFNEKAVSLGGSPKYYFDAVSGKIVYLFEGFDDRIMRRDVTMQNGLLALSDCADFWKIRGPKGDRELRPSKPSNELISAVVNADAEKLKILPQLSGISTTPVVRPDFSIHDKAGYDRVTKIYYDKRLEVSVTKTPTKEDAEKSAEALRDVFADFPFSREEDFANTMAMVLSGVMRDVIGGAMPMAVIDAPRQANGKTLLAQTVSAILTGGTTATSSLVNDTEECRKQITAILRDGDPIVLFDNIAEDTTIRTPALSRLLTSDVYSDRLLGSNDTFRTRNRAVIISTGNNIRLGGDIPRRSYRIRLDDGRVSMYDRRTFIHPEREGCLISYVKEHNEEILSHVYTLIQAWNASGRPMWSGKPLESFEQWSCVIGGVLEYCGIHNFLKNAERDSNAMCDEENAQWGEFLDKICEGNETGATFTSSNIAARCVLDGGLFDTVPYSLGSVDDRNFAKTLGEALYRHRGRKYRLNDGRVLMIDKTGRNQNHASEWRIQYLLLQQ